VITSQVLSRCPGSRLCARRMGISSMILEGGNPKERSGRTLLHWAEGKEEVGARVVALSHKKNQCLVNADLGC